MEEGEEEERVIETCQQGRTIEKEGAITSFPLKTWSGNVFKFPWWPRKISCYDFTEPSGNKQLDDINVVERNRIGSDLIDVC